MKELDKVVNPSFFVHNSNGDLVKRILYTGARSGIAYNVIKRFKNDLNYHIYVTVFNNSELKAVSKLYSNWSNIECLKIDVTNNDDLKQLEKLDIDILVSNAAIGEGGSICEIPIDRIRNNFEVNVFANINIIQLIIKKMIKKNSGRIIIMSSLAGIMPIPFIGSYCATKASLIKIGECLRKEVKILNKNIDIILIEPGLYKTGFNKLMFDNKEQLLKIGYFKNEINRIKSYENVLLYFEKEQLDSIGKKVYNAITDVNPKRVYKAPFSQAIFAKMYMLFFE